MVLHIGFKFFFLFLSKYLLLTLLLLPLFHYEGSGFIVFAIHPGQGLLRSIAGHKRIFFCVNEPHSHTKHGDYAEDEQSNWTVPYPLKNFEERVFYISCHEQRPLSLAWLCCFSIAHKCRDSNIAINMAGRPNHIHYWIHCYQQHYHSFMR